MDIQIELDAQTSVADLIDTLLKSLSAADDLHQRLKRKIDRFKNIPKTAVKGVRSRAVSFERKRRSLSPSSSTSSSDSARSGRHHTTHRLRFRRDDKHRSKSRQREDVESVATLRIAVQVQYDKYRTQLGDKFCKGDLIARMALQTQIILLQQSIIDTFQDSSLLSNYTRYPLSYFTSLLHKTASTVHFSILRILAELHTRILSSGDLSSSLPHLPGAYPSIPSIHVTAPVPALELKPPTGAGCIPPAATATDTTGSFHSTLPMNPSSLSLFCPYARTLQSQSSSSLTVRCPCCTYAPRPGTEKRAWELVLRSTTLRRHSSPSTNTLFLSSAFFLKSHRKGGGFACIFCARYRSFDTVCKRVDELVSHIWEEHGIGEVCEEGERRFRIAGEC